MLESEDDLFGRVFGGCLLCSSLLHKSRADVSVTLCVTVSEADHGIAYGKVFM